MDDLRDDNLEETENADALLDDSIFEEVDLDLEEDTDPLLKVTDDNIKDDDEEDEEEEEILDELDALAAEEEEDEGFDFFADEDEY
jgi:hypothetical protein